MADQSTKQQLEITQIVALLALDKRIFGGAALWNKKESVNRVDGERTGFACLRLKDLVWLHNHLVQDVILEKKIKTRGRMTSAGLSHQRTKYDTNFALYRNENLQPSQYKRYEANIIQKVEIQKKAHFDYNQFAIQLLKKG